MPVNFSHNKKPLKMVSEFLVANNLPSSGFDSATFWTTSEYHVKMGMGRDGEIEKAESPFGMLYTANYDHIKAHIARGLRHNFNIGISSKLGTPDRRVFIKDSGRWYVVDTANGLKLVETVNLW